MNNQIDNREEEINKADNQIDEDGCTYAYGANGHGSCFLCNTQIHGPGYAFVQWKEHYDRDYYFVACSAYTCPVGMDEKTQLCRSTCRTCKRRYIHNRYDNDYCPECPGESITEEFRRLEAEKERR